jgi:hypothetical protein
MSRRTRALLALAMAAALVQGLVARQMTRRRAFYGALGPQAMFGDVTHFHRHAAQTAQGLVPFRDFAIEYPPLIVPVFLAPRLIAADAPGYRAAFVIEMLACNGLIVALVALWVGRREEIGTTAGRLAWYALAFLSLCPMAVLRFDLAPTLLAFAAAYAWGVGRSRLGGVLAGAGILAKIFPGVIALPGMLADWRISGSPARRVRGLLALTMATAAGTAAWLALAGTQVAWTLGYHMKRGIEIQSLYAGLLIAWQRVSAGEIAHDFRFGSMEVVGRGAEALARLAFPLQAAALLLVAWRCRRAGGLDVMRGSAAAVAAFVAFGKVLTPQFVLWLLPFAACVGGRPGTIGRGLLLAACVLTSLVYPWWTDQILGFGPLIVIAMNARNALLVALWAVWTLAPSAVAAPAGAAHPAGRAESGHPVPRAPRSHLGLRDERLSERMRRGLR